MNRRPRALLSGIQRLSLIWGDTGLGLIEKYIFKVRLKIRWRESDERHWIPDKSARGRRV